MSHPAPTPAQGMKRAHGYGYAIIVLTFLLIAVATCHISKEEKQREEQAEAAAEAQRPPEVKFPPGTLIPAVECVTPCTVDLQYRAKIRTDGDPMRIKFAGCQDWHEHPGKGHVKAPSCADFGPAELVSATETTPAVKVWVYRYY